MKERWEWADLDQQVLFALERPQGISRWWSCPCLAHQGSLYVAASSFLRPLEHCQPLFLAQARAYTPNGAFHDELCVFVDHHHLSSPHQEGSVVVRAQDLRQREDHDEVSV